MDAEKLPIRGRAQTRKDRLLVVFNALGHHDPAVHPVLVIRNGRCWKEWIGEYADRDGNRFFHAFDRVVNRYAADRAKLEVCFAAFVAGPHISGRMT